MTRSGGNDYDHDKFYVPVSVNPVAAEDRTRQERHQSRCPVQRRPEYNYFDYFHDTDKR